MSGICGIVNFDGAPVDPDILRKMAEAASHRGPDGIHYWINNNVGLAHLALNTTPESLRERQPLLSADGSLCLTADARVDNRDELISTLTSKGYLQSKDPTDADLILAAYQSWGKECPKHIIGDFAFAIWDARTKELFCVRDALGIKPLHYSQVGKILCIASEAQQVIQHPAIPCRLDEVAVALHLANYCYDEERTVFQDAHRLPPAHSLSTTSEGIKIQRYWDINPEARTVYRRDEDYAQHFLTLFRRAVADRLRTQANTVGIAMSGGLDSCSIAAVAQQTIHQHSGSPHLVAYSYAFDTLKECDERSYSSAMATELGVEIEYINAEQFWFLGDPVAFQPTLETPFLGWESRDRYWLSRLKERQARVVLTGHGGDSLLQGNRLVYADKFLRGDISALWGAAKDARRSYISYPRMLYSYVFRPLVPNAIVQVVRRAIGKKPRPQAPPWIAAEFARRTDLEERIGIIPVPKHYRNLAQQENYSRILALGSNLRAVYWFDRVAASFNLEARHPFLDRRLVEFIMSIPSEQLFWAGDTKVIMRRAMDGILPQVIRLRRGKTFFDDYIDLGLREKAVSQVNLLFDDAPIGKLGIVDGEVLRESFQNYCEHKSHLYRLELWNTVTLELWIRKFRGWFQNIPRT